MKTSHTQKYTLLKAEDSFNTYINALNNTFRDLENNVILDLTAIETQEEEIKLLETFANIQTKKNKSFVVILCDFDADTFEEKLNVVPTLIEAEDIIDMEEMERDLGF